MEPKNENECIRTWLCEGSSSFSMALLFVFLNTWAPNLLTTRSQKFWWQICSVREEEFIRRQRVCVRLEAEYLCANSKFTGVISQPNHTLWTNAELADKLLNALTLIKFMRLNYASNLHYWLRSCCGLTFDWIVGHLCRSSCRWNRCCFLHIRFWNETRKRWETLIMKFLSYFENKQKIIHENFPLSSEENAHKAEREPRRQISDFLFFNRWFKTRIQVQFRTWKSQTLSWLSRKLFITKSVRKTFSVYF